jgi:hypothetical protein
MIARSRQAVSATSDENSAQSVEKFHMKNIIFQGETGFQDYIFQSCYIISDGNCLPFF